HHQNSPHTKNATRHESLLNALLCLSFKGLRFTKTKINSALIYKQKPRFTNKSQNLKTETTQNFENQTLNLTVKTQKTKIKFPIEPATLTSCLLEN
ncbi:hypothetical protein, partial [Vibrio parahaemolyticus]|uniref:hypothetical protein n=1 Tax=Vibrio parahaemolyticus TaxID=670 RepID=UPI001C5D8532